MRQRMTDLIAAAITDQGTDDTAADLSSAAVQATVAKGMDMADALEFLQSVNEYLAVACDALAEDLEAAADED